MYMRRTLIFVFTIYRKFIGYSLRYISFSMTMSLFFFTYKLFVLYHIPDFYPYMTMRNVTGLKKVTRNWLPFKSTGVQPRNFLVVSVLIVFLVSCVVYFLSCLTTGPCHYPRKFNA